MNVGFKIPIDVDSEPVKRGFDMHMYLNFLWRHWMFIGAVVILSLIMGMLYLARATPLYTATTQVLLERPQRSPTDTNGPDYRFGDRAFIETQLAIHRFDALLRQL